MQIQIDGQGIRVTDAMRDLTQEKIERRLAHFDKINRVHVTYKVDNEIYQSARATVTVPGSVINAHEKSKDMYETLDKLVDNLESQLNKYRAKMTDHHRD